MQLIKLDATDSTNLYLKNLWLNDHPEEDVVVVAEKQLKGRGQRGSSWQSEPGKNLTFSLLKRFHNLDVQNQFHLNIAVSLAIYSVLKKIPIPDLFVKWPNDILSGNSKICGILVENILQKQQIQASIIGVGLNVNQTEFPGLSHVSSLKLITGQNRHLDELLQDILDQLQTNLQQLDIAGNCQSIPAYEEVLFRKDKPSTFKDAQGELFMGFIRGVSPEGKLRVELEDLILKDFDLKEVQLMY
ncbi:biotin--[acetyl-CoA-carboxylase] ligase [Poritiphilus flavus]|uniref:Biotin--[acetyl-CoA-carboxylase] ligase n=1 Tax=Poritiphilus flavus TaxID=2697053 RepID=A0A6L9EBI2_9FLAO|nr:biotin--[acetyl-CoA-carboxylase] ligase [Poritiphilus flavus]NAS11769.1 biotin--[acetyl-CoA-carboxylase] ligase [Poritiphilus flavus]